MNVYYLEGRGGEYIYHFVVLMLGGIYNILNKINPQNSDSVKINSLNIVKYDYDDCKISLPIPIIIDGLNNGFGKLLDWQKDICNYLSHTINIINIEELNKEDKIISIYGVPLKTNIACDNHELYFPFLRNLFLKNQNNLDVPIPTKYIYISRKKAATSRHANILKRFILNEEELFEKVLKNYNFDFVFLEDLNIEEKIKLFQNANMVVSTNTGGLVFSLVANKNSKIIEIVNKSDGIPPIHYKQICDTLDIKYYRYSHIIEDYYGNFNIDIELFEKFLKEIINN